MRAHTHARIVILIYNKKDNERGIEDLSKYYLKSFDKPLIFDIRKKLTFFSNHDNVKGLKENGRKNGSYIENRLFRKDLIKIKRYMSNA